MLNTPTPANGIMMQNENTLFYKPVLKASMYLFFANYGYSSLKFGTVSDWAILQAYDLDLQWGVSPLGHYRLNFCIMDFFYTEDGLYYNILGKYADKGPILFLSRLEIIAIEKEEVKYLNRIKKREEEMAKSGISINNNLCQEITMDGQSLS